MDYRKIAQDALNARANVFEQRKAVAEDATLTDAEKRSQFEKMDADMDRLAVEARDAVNAGEREAEMRDLQARAGNLALPAGSSVNTDEPTLHDQFRSLISGELREVPLNATSAIEYRTPNVNAAKTTDAAWAGTLVADTFVAELLQSMEDSSDVLSRVRSVTTSSGEAMDWPRRVSKAGGAAAIAENGTYGSATKGGFERFTLNAFKYGMIAEVTEEMASDTSLPIAQIVAQDMGEDLAEVLSALVFNGDGSTEPHGLLVASTNDVELAAAAAVTTDELIDVQHSVIGKYRPNASWHFNDLTARDVRKLVDANGHYVWQPALVAGQPDRLLGNPVSTDPNIPVLAAGVKGLVFGDLKRAYVLRQVRAVTVVRSTEYGFDRDTLALKAKWRGDGGIADPAAYVTASGQIV